MRANQIQGRAWKYGDNVNTDVIFPGKYTYTVTDSTLWGRHALEDLDPAFAAGVQPGDVIVAGRNWGCGSSREQAAACLVQCGVGAVVAASFSRIFYRNAVNQGLPVIVCPEAVAAVTPDGGPGKMVSIDLANRRIECGEQVFSFPPFSQSVFRILQAGGLIPYVKARLAESREP